MNRTELASINRRPIDLLIIMRETQQGKLHIFTSTVLASTSVRHVLRQYSRGTTY